MGQQHRKIDIFRLVGIANAPHFACRRLNIHQGTDELFQFCFLQHLFCQNTDKQHFHAVNMQNFMGFKQPPSVAFQVHIGIDYWEVCAFFQEQQVGQTVIHFMITDCHYVRGQQVHNFYGGDAFIFRIDKRTLEHVAGNGVDNIFFFPPHLVHITGKHGNAADQLFVNFFYKEIPMEIVGMEQCQFF